MGSCRWLSGKTPRHTVDKQVVDQQDLVPRVAVHQCQIHQPLDHLRRAILQPGRPGPGWNGRDPVWPCMWPCVTLHDLVCDLAWPCVTLCDLWMVNETYTPARYAPWPVFFCRSWTLFMSRCSVFKLMPPLCLENAKLQSKQEMFNEARWWILETERNPLSPHDHFYLCLTMFTNRFQIKNLQSQLWQIIGCMPTKHTDILTKIIDAKLKSNSKCWRNFCVMM